MILTTIFLGLTLAATPQEPPVVPGYARFPDHPDAGQILLRELGCAACHEDAAVAAESKQAPILGDVGDRLKPEWLRAWLADPNAIKKGTTMPKVPLAAGEIEPLVHFLMGQHAAGERKRLKTGKANGEDLLRQVGCGACHPPRGMKEIPKAWVAIPRINLREKYQGPEPLARFLRDPHRWRPSGRMPFLNLSEEEAMAIASTLVGSSFPPRDPDAPGKTEPGLYYEYYEGSWNRLPDFDALTPAATGTTDKIHVGLTKRGDRFGFRFTGFVEIARDGAYTFFTNSDDGSALRIGDLEVVDNDGIHGNSEQSGTVFLKKGKHALRVTMFELTGGENIQVRYQGPGISKRDLPPSALSHHPSNKYVFKPMPPAIVFQPDQALYIRGKAVFQRACASCHSLKVTDKGAPKAAPLAALKGKAGGCLAGKAPAPDFSLSPKQVAALRRALENPGAALSTGERLHRRLATLNCYACHQRDGKGGPEQDRDELFLSSEKTMGIEGQVPPHLTGVGAKLTRAWLEEILLKGTKVRPYMYTRMPVFGTVNTSPLARDLRRVDDPPDDPKPVKADRKTLAAGRLLVGSKGLRCITCHVYNGKKAQSLQAMDLVHMPRRLRRTWYTRYMPDPLSLRPGTRMPSFWPDGKAALKTVLEGDTKRQLDAIWHYLAAGPKAGEPRGLSGKEILVEATATEAVMYRNFLQGLSPRGIGVAYPGGVNLAFDAQEMRLALLWQGDFINAAKHWVGRGPGAQAPAGENVLELPKGPPFARPADDGTPWPKETGTAAGFSFTGYDLDRRRRPTFLYKYGDTNVADFPERIPERALKRTLTFEGGGPAFLFRVAAGKQVKAAGDAFTVDGLTVRAPGARIRTAGGDRELVVPVDPAKGPTTITIEYRW